MSDRPEKRKVEFIESYWTGGEYGSDYRWNDNHGELVRCKDCKHWDAKKNECHNINSYMQYRPCFKDWFCADGER